MKTHITVRAKLSAILCATALVATGCASSSSAEDDAQSSGEAKGVNYDKLYVDGFVNVEEAPGDPVDGGTLTVAEYSEAKSLDPTKTYATGSTGLNVMASIYDTLMRWDMESKTWEPQLAKSLKSEDNVTWTLNLREGVNFTDGTPLNADAVVNSLNYYIENHGFASEPLTLNMKSMKATDDHTVTFTFKSPWATFPQLLSGGPGLILAPAAYKDPKNFKPIGAGPFVLKSQAPGEKTVVTANEDYFDGRPHLDAIEFVLMTTDQAKYDSLKGGEIDAAYLRHDEVIPEAVEAGWPGVMNAASGVRIINLNAREGRPTSDVRVRQAVNLAINAGTYLKRTTGSDALADRNLMAGFSTWDTGVEPVKTDLEAAKKLLAEAKADGFDGKLTYLGQSDASSKAGAVAIKAMLEAAGFEIELDLVNTVAEQVKRIYVDGDFDLALGSTSISDADPYSRLFVSLHSASLSNPGRYSNPKMDELLSELKGKASPEEGKEVLAKIEKLWKKDVPYISMAGGAFFEVWAKNVHGIQPTAETAVLFDDAWISKD